MPHQRKYANHLQKGFQKHNLASKITSSIIEDGDIHVVLGPHYAKKQWLGYETILLDRCYYKGDPEHVSLGWMRSDGGRTFRIGNCGGRIPPEIKDGPDRGGSIFLADFDGPVESADTIRHHPAREKSSDGLIDALRRHRVAIGYQTTALVTAGLEGLKVVCKDDRNIMHESNWQELLPWADWHWSEIESGEAIAHLWEHS